MSSERSCSSWTVNLLREKLFEWFLKFKKKISIKIMSYVCCMQRMQHIFDKHHECKETSFIFESWIELKHRCIKYHQWRAEQRWCVTINSTDTHKSLLEHHALNRSYRFIIWYIVSNLTVLTTWNHHVIDERFSFSESFVHSIHIT